METIQKLSGPGSRIWMFPKDNPTNAYNGLLSNSVSDLGHTVLAGSWRNLGKVRPGDILHFHWIQQLHQGAGRVQSLARTIIAEVAIRSLRLIRIHVVWTIHNILPHGSTQPDLDTWARGRLGRAMSMCFVASPGIKTLAIQDLKIPPTRVTVIPHGTYEGVYPAGHVDMRERLGIGPDTFVYLFFGAIKPYKGISHLINAFNSLGAPDAHLVIWGQPSVDMAEYLAEQVGRHPRIIIVPEFIPDYYVADLLACADVVTLPFESSTTSGSAILATTHHKLVIAPDSVFLQDVLPTPLSVTYQPGDLNGLIEALEEARSIDLQGVAPAARSALRTMAWDLIAQELSTQYLNLFSGNSLLARCRRRVSRAGP